MPRNRALQVLTDNVAQREREVLEVVEQWFKLDNEEAEDHPVGDAVVRLVDARALLAKATGDWSIRPPARKATEPAPAAPTRADRA